MLALSALAALLVAVAAPGSVVAVSPAGSLVYTYGDGARPAWSADGRVAWSDAGVVRVDNTTVGPGDDPVWSPDGSQLAWTDGGDVWIDGRRLTSDGGRKTAVSWSPDGKRVAYERRAGADASLYVAAAAGGAPQRLGFGASNVPPAWSPDGQRIAYVDDSHLFVWPGHIPLARKVTITSAPRWIGSTVVASGPRGIYAFGRTVRSIGAGADPVPSPGGARIAFTRRGVLWLMNADGTCRTRLGAYAQPAWSPAARVSRIAC